MLHVAWLRRSSTLATLLLVLAACSSPAAPAASPRPPGPATAPNQPGPGQGAGERALADFYRGKTVSILVGSGPGGVYDTWARMVGRHLRRYVPGSPNVIVENRSGADGMIALNHLVKEVVDTVFGQPSDVLERFKAILQAPS